jgi:hypothetical protein
MPIRLKIPDGRVDTGVMSDTVLSSDSGSVLPPDGDAPRLGEPTLAPAAEVAPVADHAEVPQPVLAEAAPVLPAAAPTLPAAPPPPVAEAPVLPVVSPVLTSDEVPTLPSPSPAAVPTEPEDTPETDESGHPMAHLMPGRSRANEASIRAAEIRAAQKAKSKKIKTGIAVGSLVFAAVVGPPAFKWTANAINEAGNTSTEDAD